MISVHLLIEPTFTTVIDLVAEKYCANVHTAAKLTGETERLFRYLRTAGIDRWEGCHVGSGVVMVLGCSANTGRRTRPAFGVHGP